MNLTLNLHDYKGGQKMNKKGLMHWGWFVAIALVLIILLFRFWLTPHIFIKQVDSAHEIIEKTYDADNALYNYEWFKTQFEKIGATERQIENTKFEMDSFKELYGEAKEWDFSIKNSYSQLQTTFLGQKNFYETLVADYNARSKMANREIFKDSLPFDVDKKIW